MFVPGWMFAGAARGTQCPHYSSLCSFADDIPAATKSKTSEDIAQSSKYSPAYSPDPYYHSESEYWSFQSSPKGNSRPPPSAVGKGNPTPSPTPKSGTPREDISLGWTST